MKGYIEKAKNLGNFKDKDVTFKVYLDNLNQIRSEVNALKDNSTKTVNTIKELIKNAENSLDVSSFAFFSFMFLLLLSDFFSRFFYYFRMEKMN